VGGFEVIQIIQILFGVFYVVFRFYFPPCGILYIAFRLFSVYYISQFIFIFIFSLFEIEVGDGGFRRTSINNALRNN